MKDVSMRSIISLALSGIASSLLFSPYARSAESMQGKDYTYFYYVESEKKKRQGIITPNDTKTATIFIKCTGGAGVPIIDRGTLIYHPKGCDNRGRPDHFGASKTLEASRNRGYVSCGVAGQTATYSDDLSLSNINTDICRSIAVALYGDASKVKFRMLSRKERFTALQSGEVDLLADSELFDDRMSKTLGVTYAGVSFFDDPAVMVPSDSKLKSIFDLREKTVCVSSDDGSGEKIPYSAAEWLQTSNQVKMVDWETTKQAFSSYENKKCDAFVAPLPDINEIWKNAERPQDHRVLSDVLRRMPIGVVARTDDPAWIGLLETVVSLVVWADDAKVTSTNVRSLIAKDDPSVNRVLRTSKELAKQFGFSQDWGASVIEQVGNYGETALKINPNLYKKTLFWVPTKSENEASLFYTSPIR